MGGETFLKLILFQKADHPVLQNVNNKTMPQMRASAMVEACRLMERSR
jgi:hypothetical protein